MTENSVNNKYDKQLYILNKIILFKHKTSKNFIQNRIN